VQRGAHRRLRFEVCTHLANVSYREIREETLTGCNSPGVLSGVRATLRAIERFVDSPTVGLPAQKPPHQIGHLRPWRPREIELPERHATDQRPAARRC